MEDEIQVRFELQGWTLYLARLQRSKGFAGELAALQKKSRRGQKG